MRRFIILATVAFIIGKLFVSAITSLSQNPTARTGHFNFDKSLNSGLQMGPTEEAPNPTLPEIHPTLPTFHGTLDASAAVPVAVVGKTAETAPKPVNAVDAEKKRRKKRKKKLEEKTAPVVKQEAPKVTVSNAVVQVQNPIDPGFPGTPVPVPTPNPPVKQKPVTSNPPPKVDVRAWIDALVHRPTSALMLAFMNAYHSKQITDAQFYQVLSAMQKSPNPTSRQFAIDGAIQPRYESFVILADEAQGETDPQLKARAEKYVKGYASMTELGVLNEALVKGDAFSKVEASELLKIVVDGFSKTQNVIAARNLFTPFIGVLKSLTKDPSPLIQSSAISVLADISSLLGLTSA